MLFLRNYHTHICSTCSLYIIDEENIETENEASKREMPAADKIVQELAKINKQLADMLSLKQSGMSVLTEI